MITIKNVKMLDGRVMDYSVPSSVDSIIEAHAKLLLLPSLIDPHIYLGRTDQQPWVQSLHSLIRGGISSVIELPLSKLDSKKDIEEKRRAVDNNLKELNFPLQYYFYAGFDPDKLEEIGMSKKLTLAIYLHLDPLQPENSLDDKIWEKVFRLAAWEDLPVVINGNRENTMPEFKPFLHKKSFLEKAISYTEKHSSRLYVLNVAGQSELDLIREARKRALLVYAETTPEFLFQPNQTEADHLWQALKKKEIETIGSGYSADKQAKLQLTYLGRQFNHSDPGFLLPRLLNASHLGKITLEEIIECTRLNVFNLFKIEKNSDLVLVDLEEEQIIQTPEEQTIKGWPVFSIIGGQIFTHEKSGYDLVRVE